MDGWNTSLSYWVGLFSGAMLVSGRVISRYFKTSNFPTVQCFPLTCLTFVLFRETWQLEFFGSTKYGRDEMNYYGSPRKASFKQEDISDPMLPINRRFGAQFFSAIWSQLSHVKSIKNNKKTQKKTTQEILQLLKVFSSYGIGYPDSLPNLPRAKPRKPPIPKVTKMDGSFLSLVPTGWCYWKKSV